MTAIKHGTITGYYGQHCHCDLCKAAARAYYHQYAATEPRKACSVSGCSKPARARGRYCDGHLKRIRATGSPGPATTRVMNGDESGYDAAHARVKRKRGKASEHACVGCCGQAQDWALIHGSPGIKPASIRPSGRRQGPYSLDPDHYQPMCKACHKRYDMRAEAA